MSRQQRPITDREIKAWLAAGAVDRGVGEGLTFVASTIAARAGKASWILRYRLNGPSKEKVLGRYPELSLQDAREQVRQDRAQIERGIDVTAAKLEFAKRASFTRSVKESGPAIPGQGKGPPRAVAGSAGLTVLREGGSPTGARRWAFDSGSTRSETARPCAAGRRPGHSSRSAS